jgi:hypothetical protein
MIEKSYGKYMTADGLDPLIRALAAGAKVRPLVVGESPSPEGAKTGPQTGSPLAMAVGSDLNAAIVQRKEKWSQGESNRDPAADDDAEKTEETPAVGEDSGAETVTPRLPQRARKSPKRGAKTGPGPVGES